MPVYAQPRDYDLIRCLMMVAKVGDVMNAAEVAEAHCGPSHRITTALKAAVPAGSLGLSSALDNSGLTDTFVSDVDRVSAVGQLGLRVVPLNTRVLVADGGVAYWTGEGGAKALSAGALDAVELPPRKITIVVPFTVESMKFASAKAVAVVNAILRSALVRGIDEKFVSTDAATSGAPAGILAGVSGIASSGDPVADIGALLAAFDGNLKTARFLMNPATAAQLNLRGAQFIDVGANGGTLAGVPVITSPHVASDSSGASVILLDSAQVLLAADETASFDTGRHVTLEMEDAPSGSSVTPTATQVVSMWQSNSVAMKSERFINWELASADAVAWIENASYAST